MTTGPSDPKYTYVDQPDVAGAVRFLLAELGDTQDELTRAYRGVDQVRLIMGLSVLFLALGTQFAGSKDGLRRWLEVMVLADRQLPGSGVDL